MTPIHFPEETTVLNAPKGMEATCGKLPINNANGDVCISCWQPTWKEWLKLVFGGHVWVYVMSGRTQPPIAITADDPWQKNI